MIYLDHSATTPVAKEVLDEMLPFFCDVYGNASSLHSVGQQALNAFDDARERIAKQLNCKVNEVYFTSCGCESDNWAIKGLASSDKYKNKKHIITSAIEHHTIMHACKQLENQGYEVTYLPVNSEGFVSVEDLKAAIREDTLLVTIMYANNEIGTIEPIQELAKVAHEHGVLFHTDAVQAVGYLDIDVKQLGVDMLSISAHKFYGPKGIALLYIRNGIKIEPLIIGGGQERSKRAGTSNVAFAVGMAKALEMANTMREQTNAKLSLLRDCFVKQVEEQIPYVRYNGTRDNTRRLSGNANFSFEFIEGESILLHLDFAGIAVSTGSACASGSLDPSHVMLAIGVPIEVAHSSIRFSFGKENTLEDVDYTVKTLKEKVEFLRSFSPLFSQFIGGNKNV